jgi:hypothetical protein
MDLLGYKILRQQRAGARRIKNIWKTPRLL